MPSRIGKLTRRRVATGVLTIVVVVAIVVITLAATGSSGPSYRTATVARGSVAQVLTTTGELSPVRQADVDFQVGGTVAKVRATVGHKVVAGQTLARLSRSSLQAALGSARSQLTNDRERLSEDQSSETALTAATQTTAATAATAAVSYAATQPSAHPTSSPNPSRSPGGPSGPSRGPVTTATLTHDQAAVRAAQHATDVALATAKTALATETTACAAEMSGTSSPTTTAGPKAPTISCTDAAKGLLHDQTVVNGDETAVDAAEQTLSSDLATAEKAFEKQQQSSHSSTGHNQGGSRSTTTRTTITVSAADIATDQASIDGAAAQVATAKASLRQATLTAPISGTVTAVTIAKGDSVSGQSSSDSPAVEIVGSNQDRATIYLSDTQVRTMKVGLPARLTPDGSSTSVAGRVVTIGIAGTTSDSGSVLYPVTINVAPSAQKLVAGADAAVAITLATATDVIAVPTSAVHYQGSATYVDLLSAGKLARHNVVVSAIGPTLTEVVSGLTVGQRVILANLNATVPSSSTTLTTRVGFGGGGFGPGGGFRGRGAGIVVAP